MFQRNYVHYCNGRKEEEYDGGDANYNVNTLRHTCVHISSTVCNCSKQIEWKIFWLTI